MKILADFVESLAEANPGGQPSSDSTKQLAEIEAARAELMALPAAKIKALHDAVLVRQMAQAKSFEAEKLAGRLAKEAARFYNKPGASADFDYWIKADFWTLDEAVALLLGKEPSVVNPEAFKREASSHFTFLTSDKPTEPIGFARTYQRLRALMERAEALTGPRIKPMAVVEWARNTNAADVPTPLTRLAQPTGQPSTGASPPYGVDGLPVQAAAPAETSAVQSGMTPKKWTPELVAELAAHRKAHGTKAAAAHFGVSAQRIRELLPKPKPAKAAYSILNPDVR